MTNITPTRVISGTRGSDICANSPIDLTHTGPLKIVCSNISGSLAVDEAAERPMDVYELTGPTYQVTSHLLTVWPFEIRGNPETQVAHFRKSVDSTGPYILRVINGDRTGSNRVSSGTITLNNVIIVEPSQLSAGTEFIEISIESVPILNVLKAELGGTAGAKILITVTDRSGASIARQTRATRPSFGTQGRLGVRPWSLRTFAAAATSPSTAITAAARTDADCSGCRRRCRHSSGSVENEMLRCSARETNFRICAVRVTIAPETRPRSSLLAQRLA